MALVLLPCDLPTWPTLQRHLTAMKREVRTAGQLKDALLKIYNLCNTSLEPDDESLGDQRVFDVLCDEVVDTWLSDDERQDLFDTQLPTMVDYALQLKSLKPLRGLHFSLQQQSDRVEIDRRFAASLVAHAFFSTFPRRTVKTHPTLQDFNFAGHFFQHLNRRSQRAKLRSILHYFQRLNERPPEGHVTFARQVMSGREWCTLEDWLQCRRPLCPLVVRHDGRVEYPSSDSTMSVNNNRPSIGQSSEPPAGIRVCFASRRIGGSFLDDGTSQECAAFSSHPELLSLLPYVESLEDNEAITASGLCTYSIIHDLKNKAVFDATAGQQTTTANAATKTALTTTSAATTSPISSSSLQQVTQAQTAMCLIDAEDYSDLPIRQYEEDNVLRELNKAYLGFGQHYPEAARAEAARAEPPQQKEQPQLEQRLPLVNASRDLSPSSRQASTITDHTISQDWADLTRSTTLVASSGDPSSPRPSICPSMASQDQSPVTADETDRGRSASNPTLLYGGGRNAPLTLAKATIVKQIMTRVKDAGLSELPSSCVAKKAGSIYASCHSQDDDLNSSVEEFRSANTSLDEDEAPSRAAALNRMQRRRNSTDRNGNDQLNKSRGSSSESDSSAENGRPQSRGFALDSNNEEDSFSGDGLEREKRWLEHFRERRGPRSARSGLKDSSSSSKDSSRYSFSTEFSSELDELYDQFSHWLDDPNGGESVQQNGRNAAVFRFAHGLLKRALSDSFASVALSIENLSAHPETLMKDIKLAASSESRRGSTKRSWSLNEHVGDERLALQLAKEMVERETLMEEQALPMPDIVPLLPVDAIEEEETLDEPEEPQKMATKKKGNSKSKMACQLTSNGNQRDDEKQFGQVNGGLLPIITGNWGCGSSGGGDAQLKSMLQWLAASRSGAPSLVYYTAGASSVVKLDIVCRVIMDRQWTVGDLAGALLRYCRARLDPRRLDLISRLETHYQAAIAGSSSGVDAADERQISLSTCSECPGSNPGTDRLLFDELLGQYPLKQTEL
ncbi:uncharacterized protein LOC116923912 isoform X3 [Daphnia magna]|uniref:uncharacterized protein LOC116923912 isoform X3 n=1 Tax=Daphnia magna TaxID=35525 RepID=UPI001E1B9F7A|nr:uncharacterized protein LOC116923912 isoform X3 [Daphnia magna]